VALGQARGTPIAGTFLRKAASSNEVDEDVLADPMTAPISVTGVDRRLASPGHACASGLAPMLWPAGAVTAGADRAVAAPVTARVAPAVTAHRARLGRRLLIRFYGAWI